MRRRNTHVLIPRHNALNDFVRGLRALLVADKHDKRHPRSLVPDCYSLRGIARTSNTIMRVSHRESLIARIG